MITEQYKDKVFFSQWLRTDYPNIYKDVCEILDANNVAHETLPLTKDYWCRDYMPIQFACDRFSQFVYNPDYLKGKEKYITDVDKVMNKIEESYYKNPREILLFFYYPSDEYVAYLMTKDTVSFFDEIDCRDLFEGDNKREKILIFEINY